MLIVHAFATPNSVKVLIALEELGLEYQLEPVNIRQGEQKVEAFVSLNANAKVPVLVDTAGYGGQPMVLTESAAILVYLAERYKQLLPEEGLQRARVFEQLFFHASAISPSFGQSGFFLKLASEPNPVAIARFQGEAKRTLAVLEGLLAHNEFVAGEQFSIADIAHFGWMWRREFAGVDFSVSPNVERWYTAVSNRPAVIRAIARSNALIPQS
ncbi:glutathione S-transferase family protein [Pseudomonas sp. NPDC087358]|uniref:glutathione S-transferase family protein n=1 Tax=Pseudomonas sp. NPDC087358 TaxID=3364439 RepID=UPI00384BF96D